MQRLVGLRRTCGQQRRHQHHTHSVKTLYIRLDVVADTPSSALFFQRSPWLVLPTRPASSTPVAETRFKQLPKNGNIDKESHWIGVLKKGEAQHPLYIHTLLPLSTTVVLLQTALSPPFHRLEKLFQPSSTFNRQHFNFIFWQLFSRN